MAEGDRTGWRGAKVFQEILTERWLPELVRADVSPEIRPWDGA